MKSHCIRYPAVIILCLALAPLGGCSGMTDSQQRVLSGAAIGTGVGVVGTAMTGGCIRCGAAIGAAGGAVAGAIVDQNEKKHGN